MFNFWKPERGIKSRHLTLSTVCSSCTVCTVCMQVRPPAVLQCSAACAGSRDLATFCKSDPACTASASLHQSLYSEIMQGVAAVTVCKIMNERRYV